MVSTEYVDCLAYIEKYWSRIIKDPEDAPKNNGFLKLPYRYITPNDKKFTYLFYWDTYFMFRGLIGQEKSDIMKEVVDNHVYLLKKYGIVPNFNSHASTNRSQPPFLSSMVFDVYSERKSKKWLESRIQWVKWEYEQVWIDRENNYNHSVQGFGLIKYGDRDVGYAHTAELESGWDFTSRFYNRCNQFFPIDLNCFLLQYERDFVRAAAILGDKKEHELWTRRLNKRSAEINKYLWNEEYGYFCDYDFARGRQSKFLSLASFVPLWAGLATPKQAFQTMRQLPEFETKYGLVISSAKSLPPELRAEIENEEYRHFFEESIKPKQWDYPNIWPPLEYMAVIGMLKYGFIDEAKRIMHKSLAGEAKVFRKHGTFFEKMDGVTGDAAANFHYANQSGFGWTNAVFLRYVKILDEMEKNGDDSIYAFPMFDIPPYHLSILH